MDAQMLEQLVGANQLEDTANTDNGLYCDPQVKALQHYLCHS